MSRGKESGQSSEGGGAVPLRMVFLPYRIAIGGESRVHDVLCVGRERVTGLELRDDGRIYVTKSDGYDGVLTPCGYAVVDKPAPKVTP